jgi:hypothetical protein
MIFDKLKQFRESAYTLLGLGKDAIVDLMDAVLTSPQVNSFVELSLSPVFRRAWPSVYSAFQQTAKRPTDEALPGTDTNRATTTVSRRPHGLAATGSSDIRDRTIEHQATQIAGNKPIVVGHGFSTIAWIPEAQGVGLYPET